MPQSNRCSSLWEKSGVLPNMEINESYDLPNNCGSPKRQFQSYIKDCVNRHAIEPTWVSYLVFFIVLIQRINLSQLFGVQIFNLSWNILALYRVWMRDGLTSQLLSYALKKESTSFGTTVSCEIWSFSSFIFTTRAFTLATPLLYSSVNTQRYDYRTFNFSLFGLRYRSSALTSTFINKVPWWNARSCVNLNAEPDT